MNDEIIEDCQKCENYICKCEVKEFGDKQVLSDTEKQKIIDELDKILPKMIADTVWCITDGGRQLKESDFLIYQDEPVKEFEDIKSYFLSILDKTIKSKLEAVEGEIKEKKKHSAFCKGRNFGENNKYYYAGSFKGMVEPENCDCSIPYSEVLNIINKHK